MPKFYPGIAGRRGYNPTGLILHNDAGSKNATAAFYRGWLKDHDAYSGFAHYYTASDGTYQAEDDQNVAWHSGNPKYNQDFIGIEACQSLGDSKTFLANEDECLKLMAKLCKKYGITPNRDTIKLHQEVSSTTCPHRSYDLHGRSINDVKDYFISQIKKYMAPKPARNPLKDGKVGDTVKIVEATYTSVDGKGRSLASIGKTGVIEKVLTGNKKYLIRGLGYTHPNDIELVRRGAKNGNDNPLANGKIGDKVVIFDALYSDSDGKGRSTKSRGKTGVIDRIVDGNKKYHIKGMGWAHPNDIKKV